MAIREGEELRTVATNGVEPAFVGAMRQLGPMRPPDGSEHPWFEDRGPPCTLLAFVDDATSRLMELRFVKSESVSYTHLTLPTILLV